MTVSAKYIDSLRAIHERSGYDRGFISNPFAGDEAARLGLQRTQELLNFTGHSQLPYAIVHVAGSKGKGSTCTLIDAMLRAAGLRTGRYTSPHLHSFRERFVVNNSQISQRKFAALTAEFVLAADSIEQASPQLGEITAFELTTAMALAWFSRQDCDIAVIEVGMGGTLDSTNIVSPTVSVITTLDYEHTAILGDSIEEIAANKAGIIKPNRPVLTAHQPPDALHVIAEQAASVSSPLAIAGRDWDVSGTYADFTFSNSIRTIHQLRLNLVGAHQMGNAGLAIAAVLELGRTHSDLQIEEAAIRSGLEDASIPARFERTSHPLGIPVVIDGAHTPASSQALTEALIREYPAKRITVVIGMLADKNPEAVLAPLSAIAYSWIAFAPNNPRALSVVELSKHLGETVRHAEDMDDAISKAAESEPDVIVITGSFTTAAEARIALGLVAFVDPAV